MISILEVMHVDVKPSVIITNYVTNSQMVYFTDCIFLDHLMVFLDSTNLKIFTRKYSLYN